MLSHRPFGAEHPYRFDLDQRVPVSPIAGEDYEIRVLADPQVTTVEVVFTDGTRVPAHRVDPSLLVVDHGPPAARRSSSSGTFAETATPAEDATSAPAVNVATGHLDEASAALPETGGKYVWVAIVRAAADARYQIVGRTGDSAETATQIFAVTTTTWQASGGRLILVDPGGVASLDPDSVRWLVDDQGPRRVWFALRLGVGEHVVGFGERFNALDQRGEAIDAMLFEQYKQQGHRTYLPMPFALVTSPSGSWGLHIETSRRTWFDVGASTPDLLLVDAEVDPHRPEVTLRLFTGDPAGIVASFVASTGPATLPPDWVFRPWISGNEWNTQQRVLAEVDRSLADGIPVGAVVIEAWSDESTFVAFRDAKYPLHPDGKPHQLRDFEFPPDGAWPDPKAMVDRLHDVGVKVLLWQIPLIPTDRGAGEQVEADAQALTSHGFAVREADGTPYRNRGWWFPGSLLPDFTNPAAVDWWIAKRRYLVDELGVDGFKTDGGEHAWGHDLRYADGTTGQETNNRYPVLYAAAYHRLTDVTFSRAGFTGAAAYPCHWAGDEDSTWEAYRASITAGLTAGIGGVYFWGWDLAGFSGEIPDAELYLRSAAMACFCPIMQYHSEFNHHRTPSRDRTPWNIADRTGSPEVLPTFRTFAVLRESLVPYLAEQARQSVGSGRPLMRPLFFDFPRDEHIWRWPLQYQLGDDLLVAPVTSPGATTWPVYLPAGEWEDFFTGERHIGPTVVNRAAPLADIPVYRRLPPAA